MQITRIALEDVRAVRHLELDLSLAPGIPRKRTVILGVNGAGKTTILDGIVHAFATLAGVTRLGANLLGGSDVRNDQDPDISTQTNTRHGAVKLEVVLTNDDQQVVRQRYPSAPMTGVLDFLIGKLDWNDFIANPLAWKGHLLPFPPGLPLPPLPSGLIPGMPPSGALEAPVTFGDMARVAVAAGETHPICVFLPSDRGILEVHEDLSLNQVMEFDSCNNSLSRARQRFAPLAARLALCGTPPRTDAERAVARMWKVIKKYFPEMPRPIEPKGSMLRFHDRRGAIVPLTSLSDGERAILLIFADLALRDPQNNVVLIDELEQHLHPRWQRQMLYGLSSLLPNVQFIVTTQSPYLAACAPDDVIKLPEWDTHGE